MTDDAPARRRVLGLLGGAVAAPLAGCLDDTGTPTDAAGDDNDGNDENDGEDGNDENEGEDGNDDGDHDHDHGHELGHPEDEVEVSMESDQDANTHHFVPHVVHVEEGGAVTWVLDSGGHDTVAYHPDNADLLPTASERRIPETAEPWASDFLRTEGETFELTVEEPGIYDYACTVVEHGHGPERGQGPVGHHPTHEETGMVGRVIVGWPDLDPDEQPAIRAPPDELPDAARDELEAFDERTRAALEHDDEH